MEQKPILVTGSPKDRPHWARIFSSERVGSHNEKVRCGQLLSRSRDIVRGYGTYDSKNGLLASVCGLKVQYNCLIQIEPFREKYYPKVGDVVVGRILRVRKARWKVDVKHRVSALLLLGNVNLPGGVLRRKNVEDEIFMSEHLRVGDLVSAEVQQLRGKEKPMLHTRNLRYGKLGQGILLKVWPTLVKRQKKHMHDMFGFGVIMGCNGLIWISSIKCDHANGGFYEDLSFIVSREKRNRMVRLASCVGMLARNLISIYDISIQAAYLASLDYEIKDLALPQVVASLLPSIIETILYEEKRQMDIRDREEQALLRRSS